MHLPFLPSVLLPMRNVPPKSQICAEEYSHSTPSVDSVSRTYTWITKVTAEPFGWRVREGEARRVVRRGPCVAGAAHGQSEPAEDERRRQRVEEEDERRQRQLGPRAVAPLQRARHAAREA